MTITRLGQLTAETQGTDDFVTFGAVGPTISSIKAKTGTYSYRYNGNMDPFGYPIAVSDHVRAGFWFNHAGPQVGTAPIVFLWFAEGGVEENSVRYDDNTGLLELMVNDSVEDSVSAASVGFNTLDTWMHCGLFVRNGVAGIVSFYLNGERILTYAGDTSQSDVGSLYVSGNIGIFAWNSFAYVDDFYVDALTVDEGDSAPPSKRFLFSIANGAGANAAFTPVGAASNYQAVDDAGAHDEDTTYNKALVADLKDTFQTENLTLPLDYVIRAVIPVAIAKKTDAAGGLGIRLHAWDGATYLESGIKTLSTAYQTIWERFPSQPDASSWVEVDFNAMQFGYESETVV